jgi:hypothetical protein
MLVLVRSGIALALLPIGRLSRVGESIQTARCCTDTAPVVVPATWRRDASFRQPAGPACCRLESGSRANVTPHENTALRSATRYLHKTDPLKERNGARVGRQVRPLFDGRVNRHSFNSCGTLRSRERHSSDERRVGHASLTMPLRTKEHGAAHTPTVPAIDAVSRLLFRRGYSSRGEIATHPTASSPSYVQSYGVTHGRAGVRSPGRSYFSAGCLAAHTPTLPIRTHGPA